LRFPLPNHPGLAGSGFEFSRDNVGVLLGFSVFSLLASELEVVPLALSASSRSEANGVFSEAVNKINLVKLRLQQFLSLEAFASNFVLKSKHACKLDTGSTF
jgi:hypothetical protein